MKILAINIKTTGDEPRNLNQLLAISGIIFDFKKDLIKDVDKLPFFTFLVKQEQILGSPEALSINAELIKTISDSIKVESTTKKEISIPMKFKVGGMYHEDQLETLIKDFLNFHKVEKHITLTGKNITNFEMPFLKSILDETFINDRFHKRFFDVGVLHFDKEIDTCIPSLATIKKRLDMKPLTNNSLEDARDIIRVIQKHYESPVE